jgi:hypothetical protein
VCVCDKKNGTLRGLGERVSPGGHEGAHTFLSVFCLQVRAPKRASLVNTFTSKLNLLWRAHVFFHSVKGDIYIFIF